MATKKTKQEFISEAKMIVDDFTYDNESLHISLDELLLKIASHHGYDEVVELFKKQPLWYA